MTEYPSFPAEKRVISAVIGTITGTLLGPVPPQMTMDIYQVNVVSYVGNATGFLMQSLGTVGFTPDSGSIVEPFAVGSVGILGPFLDGNGVDVVTKVSPGYYLTGVLVNPQSAASVQARITYMMRYGRG